MPGSEQLKLRLSQLTPQQLATLSAQNHDAEIFAVASVFSALATLAVLMRTTSRHMKKVAFGVDDGLIVAALVIAVGQTIFICIGVRDYNLGRHIWLANEEQLVNFNKLWYTAGTLQCSGLAMIKMSFCILFHRIFVTPAFRLGIKIVGAITLLGFLGTILAQALLCIPVSKIWYPDRPGHCGNKHLVAILPPIQWIATDVALLLMPVTMVWRLHLPRLKRVGLAALFLLGGLSTFASCFRYSLLFYSTVDITWDIIPATIWTIIELDIAIVAVCLISSRPWFTNLISKIKILAASTHKTPNSKSQASTVPGFGGGNGKTNRRPFFSGFRRLDTRPPAVTTISIGAPFELDLEKYCSEEHGGSNGSELKTINSEKV